MTIPDDEPCPKVSVAMITYNHERYVAQAIESALMQRTAFDYEIVIGEDCSTDHTRDIVIGLQRQHPGRVRLLLRESNLGMMRNYVSTLQACRGQYVAYLEGDDYWTSPTKLQRQAELMDQDPDCALCFHNVHVEYEDGTRALEPYCPAGQKTSLTVEDLLRTNPIPHGSVMMRRRLLGEFPGWYYELAAADRPLFLMLAQSGTVRYLDDVMGVYRLHGGGVYTSRSYDQRFAEALRMYEAFSAHLGPSYDQAIAEAKRDYAAELVTEKAKAAASFREGMAAAQHALDEWQTAYALPGAWRDNALGRVYAYYLFSSRSGEVDRSTARHCFLQMARHDPSWLRNRGVWSLAGDAFLGRPAMDWLRRASGFGRARPRHSEER